MKSAAFVLMVEFNARRQIMRFRHLPTAASIIALSFSATSLVYAEQALDAPRYTLNFESVELQTVIESVANMDHKTIIVDPRIKTSELVTLKSDHALSGSEAYQRLKLLLAMHGWATIENRSIVKVVPNANVPAVRT
jgi:type II secretory pathway component GspD/PulD (secretin)